MMNLSTPPRAPRLPRDHFYPHHTVAENVRAAIYIVALIALVIWRIRQS